MEALPKPETTEFDLDPADAVRLVALKGRIETLSEVLNHQRTLFGVVLDRIRAKAGLPEGADFKTDETGLKGRYEAPKES